MPASEPELITSAANPVVKRVRALAERKHRRRENAFVVEGLQPVWRAVTAGVDLELVVYAPQLLISRPAQDLVAELAGRGVRTVAVSAEIFGRLSERDSPAGLLAVVSGGLAGLEALTVTPDSLFVLLHEPASPGNVGTIIRTADAAGATGVILLGPGADPLSPAALKASMGSLFAQPVVAAGDESGLLGWARSNRLHLVALTGSGAQSLWQAELPRPLVVMLGNEGRGLTDSLLAAADARVRIPMTGTAESLNVAAAAAVALFELSRRQV